MDDRTIDQKAAVRRGYDGLAENYAAERAPNGDEHRILETFRESLSDQSRILDAGCGQGTPVLRELDATATAVGLDFSREQLRLAAAAVPSAPLVQGDMAALPFPENAFDGITAYHSLIHVPLEQHQTVVDEFARVLEPNGRVVLTEGTAEWTGANPDWLESGVEMRWEIAGPEATREHLQTAGFRLVDEWNVADELADEDAWKSVFLARLDS